jgi:hypothetical protein
MPEHTQDSLGVLFNTSDNPPTELAPQVTQSTSITKRLLLIFLGIVLLIGLAGVGIWFGLQPNNRTLPAKALPTPSPVVITSPTPAASPSAQLQVQILNGSGVTGVASVTQEFLEEKGYTIVDTGNADNYDYEQTEVLGKEDYEAEVAQLVGDLAEDYAATASAELVDEDEEFELVVIVGKR